MALHQSTTLSSMATTRLTHCHPCLLSLSSLTSSPPAQPPSPVIIALLALPWNDTSSESHLPNAVHEPRASASGSTLDFMATLEEPDPDHEHSVHKRPGRSKRMVDKDFKIRRSSRLAKKEPDMFEDMTACAINLKKLKDKLDTCSVAMKSVAYKHGLAAHGLPVVTLSAAILDMAVCSKPPPPCRDTGRLH